jgi:hypothetical protein
LIDHHGNSILALGGLQGFSSWRAAQPETVAPRRLPDGLLELRYPGQAESEWVLVEIETYPERDVDRQVFEDLQIVTLDKGVVPEVICLVLRQRGLVEVTGTAERVSRRHSARLTASWKVVRLWDLRAVDLLATGDVGLVPWVPLTHSDDPPEVVLTRCREQIDRVIDPSDRAGLLAVTQILAALAYPDRKLLELLGGLQMITIESPLLDEIREVIQARAEAEVRGRVEAEVRGRVEAEVRARAEAEGRIQTLRKVVRAVLAARFAAVPPELPAELDTLTDEGRLEALHQLAVTCPNLEAFLVGLNEPQK